MLFPLFLTIKHRRDIVYRRKTKQFEIAANVERALLSNRALKLKKKLVLRQINSVPRELKIFVFGLVVLEG